MQRGASLLELAIVTAVMGLFVGAVLVSINMVKSATTRNFINSIEATNSKAATFQLRFSALPGDIAPAAAQQNSLAPRAGTPGHGNANGLIEGCDAALMLGCENTLFWRDLSDARLYHPPMNAASDAPVDGTKAGFALAAYLPETPFPRVSSIFLNASQNRNRFHIASLSVGAASGALLAMPALNPIQAEAIDEKMDDRLPLSGHVRAMQSLSEFEDGIATDAPMKCVEAARYTSESSYNDAPLCQLSIDAGF